MHSPFKEELKRVHTPLENMLKLTLSGEQHAQQVAETQRSAHIFSGKDTHD